MKWLNVVIFGCFLCTTFVTLEVGLAYGRKSTSEVPTWTQSSLNTGYVA